MEISPNSENTIQKMLEQLNKLQTLICERVTFTTVEVAFKTGLDESTICNYCRMGAIKSVQLVKGGSYIIPVSELNRILDEASANKRNSKTISTAALNIIKNKKQ